MNYPDRGVYRIEDGMKSVNGENLAATISAEIITLGVRNIGGPFLGLGAGNAQAERGLAKRLGLEDITLVDKDHENIIGFQGRYIESDLFKFMETEERKYGVVTAFSLEYTLEDNWLLFWKGLQNITRPDSLILVAPYDAPMPIDSSLYTTLRDQYGLIVQRIR